MSDTLILWADPDEADQGINSGYEIFNGTEQMLKWLNVEIAKKPELQFSCYEVTELNVEPVSQVTKYVITGRR